MKILKTDNMVGAAFMSGSMAGLAFNDAIIKFSASEMSIYQIIFIRGLFTVLLIGTFAWISGTFRNMPSRADQKLIAWRSLAEFGATVSFLSALLHMPLANITAILQILPLTISIAAAIFLGEYIGWRRTIAILIGLIGILIIVRPGTDGFNSYSILGLTAVGFATWRDLIVRQISNDVSSLLVSFITAVVITIAGGAIALILDEWSPVPNSEFALFALAAVFLFGGYYASIAAMRVGKVAFVTPFRYTIMLWAILLGWLIWGDIPDYWTLIGTIIIIATGAYTVWRERKI
jgi:drug/metabolite transporter (DMT)-like permease